MEDLERTAPEAVGISSAAVLDWLDAVEATGTEMHGFMLARYGKVCAEGWWRPYAPQLLHSQQSLTKTYAVTALGALHDEGLLSLDEKVTDIFREFMPDHPGEGLRRMTVRHLLSMSSGIRQGVDFSRKDWLRDFFALPVEEAPGSGFQYSGIYTAVAASIIRRKTGMGLLAYMGPRILEKIGIDAAKVKSLRCGDGMEYAGGGFFTTTEDNLRLMMLYLNEGVWNGERVLSKAWCKAVTSKQIDTATEAVNNPGSEDNYVGYGLQCWMCRPEGVYRADGAMGQFAIVFPSQHMVLAINQTADLKRRQHQKVLNTVWDVLLPGVVRGCQGEDSDAARRLQERLSRLALPRCVYPLRAGMADKVDGVVWRMEENQRMLLPGVRFGAIGGELAGMDDISLRFPNRHETYIEWRQHGVPMRVKVGTGGIPAVNHGCYGPAELEWLWAEGGWKAENVFACELRMLETCFAERYTFVFAGEQMTLLTESIGAQPGAQTRESGIRGIKK